VPRVANIPVIVHVQQTTTLTLRVLDVLAKSSTWHRAQMSQSVEAIWVWCVTTPAHVRPVIFGRRLLRFADC